MDIDNLYVWFDDNFLEEYNRPSPLHLSRSKQICMERVHSYKYLGVWLTCNYQLVYTSQGTLTFKVTINHTGGCWHSKLLVYHLQNCN